MTENLNTHSNWMRDTFITNSNILFRNIILPGTHNSGTYKIKWPASIWAKNQNLNFTEQLESGIRYFDLRIEKVNDKYYFTHDPSILNYKLRCFVRSEELINGLIEIQKFSKDHPKEIIILDFNLFYKMNDTGEDDVNLMNIISDKLEKYMLTPLENGIENLTLSNIWESNENIIVLYKRKITGTKFWCDKDYLLISPWINNSLETPDELFNKMKTTISSSSNSNLFVLQSMLAIKKWTHTLKGRSKKMNTYLEDKNRILELNNYAIKEDKHLNIIILDYFNLYFKDENYFVDYLIALNKN
jgi:hypothetical protein